MRPICALVFALAVLTAGAALAQETRPRRPDGTPIYATKTREIRLDYSGSEAFEQISGSSIFFTQDFGRTWQKANTGLNAPEKAGEKAFAIFKAFADGHYGFRFVRPGEAEPGNGTSIELAVFIDTTAPAVQVLSPTQGQDFTRLDTLSIRYQAQDDNLDANKGLTLHYSIDGGATWENIVTGAPLTYLYEWKPNISLANDLHLKVKVRDVVGNESEVVVQQIGIGRSGGSPRSDKPVINVAGPELGKIYFEKTDFYYEVINATGSPTAYVAIWFTMDGGQTWTLGGTNKTGESSGKVVVEFRPGFRRHARFGNYEHIGFHYQVVTSAGLANAEDPMSGTSPMASFLVDTAGPKLGVRTPALDDKLYRGRIPGNPDSGKYSIEWVGADRNPVPFVTTPGMERGPVSIFYSPDPLSRQPNWVMLADRLEMIGSFVRDNDLPLGPCRIRVVAIDQMGNQTIRETGVFTVLDGPGYEAPEKGGGKAEVDRLWAEGVMLYHTGKYKEAMTTLDKALEIAPSERADSIRHDKSLALYKDGRLSDAQKLLERIVGNQPENLSFRFTLATLHFNNNKRNDAKEQLDKIAELDAKEPHIRARSMLAKIEKDNGNNDRAAELWRFILKHASAASDEYKDAQTNLGRASTQAAK